MVRDSKIKPTSFYSGEDGKTKLNWFCYELALAFELAVKEKLAKPLNLDDQLAADFSVYLAKEMKEVVLEKLAGKVETVYFSDEMVLSYFPALTDDEVGDVLGVLSEAWDSHLAICEVCPTRCISEKDAYCTMFDEGPY